jgi:repressor LexA
MIDETERSDARKRFTPRQGQFLAFIHWYTKLSRRPPAEADLQRYFGVTSAAEHQMVVTLERNGLIARTPGAGRSIRLLVERGELPDLE